MQSQIVSFIFIVIVGVSLSERVLGNSRALNIKTFLPEDGCSRQGGLCVLETQCPFEDTYLESNLCPKQAKDGAVCCSKIPVTIPCEQRGGECLPEAECGGLKQTFGDCGPSNVCCIFV